MTNYGFEHLHFSRSTYRNRAALLIVASLSVLFFEYRVTDNLQIYSVVIPEPLIRLALYLSAGWTAFQFIFSSVDDFIDWKKNFLINELVRPEHQLGDRTILVEIYSFSKGKIKYVPFLGRSYGGQIPEVPELKEVKDGFDAHITDLEGRMKEEITSIENFQKWYRNFSWFTIFRFSIVEFSLPLLFLLYATVVCQVWPILPK
jgi:hypothetical protein